MTRGVALAAGLCEFDFSTATHAAAPRHPLALATSRIRWFLRLGQRLLRRLKIRLLLQHLLVLRNRFRNVPGLQQRPPDIVLHLSRLRP